MTARSPAETALPSPRVGVDRVGVVALVVGTAIIAWSGVLARFLDVGPLAGAAWRMGLAVPALAAWTRFARRGQTTSRRALTPVAGLLILAGLAFALDVGSFHISLTGTKVANATFIGNVAPILTVVGGALFFREAPSWRVWLALALALVGAWVMAGMAAPAQVGYGDAFALSAAIAYATYLLIIKQLRVRLDAATATQWSAAVSASFLPAPPGCTAKRWSRPAPSAGRSSSCSAWSRTRPVRGSLRWRWAARPSA